MIIHHQPLRTKLSSDELHRLCVHHYTPDNLEKLLEHACRLRKKDMENVETVVWLVDLGITTAKAALYGSGILSPLHRVFTLLKRIARKMSEIFSNVKIEFRCIAD